MTGIRIDAGGRVLCYGNPAGYVNGDRVVVDPFFQTDELSGFLETKGFKTIWRDGTYAAELIREVEISGEVGDKTSAKASELSGQLGIDPQIAWSKTGRIQLNEEVTVTLTLERDIGLFGGFASSPLQLRAEASGKSEVYWK